MRTFLLATALAGLIGCGGSIKGNGPDASNQPVGCATLDECACYAASDRCSMVTESCWCPSVCDSKVACVCGGGKYLGCVNSPGTDSCDAELARVQVLCVGQPFVNFLSGICASNPTCIAGCLSQLGTVDSCAQIDCSFCTTCDCSGPAMPSPLGACVAGCALPPPPLR
jgi:hypothetical protein